MDLLTTALQDSTASELWTLFLLHPVAILGAAAAVAAAAFVSARFLYEREISTLRTRNDGLKEEIGKLQTEVGTLRARAPVPVMSTTEPPPLSLREAHSEFLRRRAREMAEALREIQELYGTYEHRFAPAGATEEERRRIWEEGLKRDEQRRMEVARRYSKIRGEVIALREELLRRVHPSIPAGRGRSIDITYEMQAGPGPFHEIADDLEKLALNLP